MTGTIRVNQKERILRKFRKMACYIMQDDHLLPHISVWEAMMCSANLKLSEKMTHEEKRVLVSEGCIFCPSALFRLSLKKNVNTTVHSAVNCEQ